MKIDIAKLKDLVNREDLMMAELYEITLSDGLELYFTSFSDDIIYEGKEYKAAPIQRGEVTYNVNLQADEVSVTVSPVDLRLIKYVARGALDGAKLFIKLMWFSPVVGAGFHYDLFYGFCNVSFTFRSITINAVSYISFSNIRIPRNYYSDRCNWVLYSEYCGAKKKTFDLVVKSGSLSHIIVESDYPNAAHFLFGEAEFKTGLNRGAKRTIIKSERINSSDIVFWFGRMLLEVPSVGDIVSASFGCDKTLKTCREVFKNAHRFFGFPDVPNPDEIFG